MVKTAWLPRAVSWINLLRKQWRQVFFSGNLCFRLFVLWKRKEESRMELMKRLLKEEEGQAVIEYVVIAAMLSIVAIGLVGAVGIKLGDRWNAVLSPGLDDL